MAILRIDKVCPICKTAFSVPPSKGEQVCCSRTCVDVLQAADRVNLTCKNCGKPFTVPPSKARHQYCSNACRYEAARGKPNPKGTYIEKTCPECGKAFRRSPSRAYVICCSRECHLKRTAGLARNYTSSSRAKLTGRPRKSKDETRACLTCGTEFAVPEYNPKIYCSRECSFEARRNKPKPEGTGVAKSCAVCETQFWVPPCREKTAKCCSYKCAGIYRRGKRMERLRDMSEAEIAWLAGLFDGEGSIVLVQRHRPGGGSVRISIANTVESMLLKVREITGVGGIAFKASKNPRHKDQGTWSLAGQDALELIRRMRPWLFARAERADAVLAGEWFPRQARWDHLYPPEERDKSPEA